MCFFAVSLIKPRYVDTRSEAPGLFDKYQALSPRPLLSCSPNSEMFVCSEASLEEAQNLPASRGKHGLSLRLENWFLLISNGDPARQFVDEESGCEIMTASAAVLTAKETKNAQPPPPTPQRQDSFVRCRQTCPCAILEWHSPVCESLYERYTDIPLDMNRFPVTLTPRPEYKNLPAPGFCGFGPTIES